MADSYMIRNVVMAFLLLSLVGCGGGIREGMQSHSIKPRYSAVQAQGGYFRADPAVQEYVTVIGMRLVRLSGNPSHPFEFVVVNSSIPDSWSLAEGRIAVTRGLLVNLNNEAELAAVLGHAIAHVLHHGDHRSLKGDIIVGDVAVMDLFSGGYGRAVEQEADRFAIELMVRAGYDPQAAVDLQYRFEQLKKANVPLWNRAMFQTHQPSMERVAFNRQQANQYKVDLMLAEKSYQDVMGKLKAKYHAYELYDQAVSELAEGDPESARGSLHQAISMFGNEAAFHALYAMASAKLGAVDEAEFSFNKAIEKDNTNYRHYLDRGLFYQGKGRSAEAEQDLEKSIKLLPTAMGLFALGELSLKTDEPEQAKRYFKQASGSKSGVGRQAMSAFAMLDFSDHPDDYLTIIPKIEGSVVEFMITNKAPHAIQLSTIKLDAGKQYNVLVDIKIPSMKSVRSRVRIKGVKDIKSVVVGKAKIVNS